MVYYQERSCTWGRENILYSTLLGTLLYQNQGKYTLLYIIRNTLVPGVGKIYFTLHYQDRSCTRIRENILYSTLLGTLLYLGQGKYTLLYIIRNALVPGVGNLYLSADYCQLELRILAHLSQEKPRKYSFHIEFTTLDKIARNAGVRTMDLQRDGEGVRIIDQRGEIDLWFKGSVREK